MAFSRLSPLRFTTHSISPLFARKTAGENEIVNSSTRLCLGAQLCPENMYFKFNYMKKKSAGGIFTLKSVLGKNPCLLCNDDPYGLYPFCTPFRCLPQSPFLCKPLRWVDPPSTWSCVSQLFHGKCCSRRRTWGFRPPSSTRADPWLWLRILLPRALHRRSTSSVWKSATTLINKISIITKMNVAWNCIFLDKCLV